MTNKQTHTPGPKYWKYEWVEEWKTYVLYYREFTDHEWIMSPYRIHYKPHAHHIVKCVNVHDELVEALKKAKERIENSDAWNNGPTVVLEKEYLALCKAIAKA